MTADLQKPPSLLARAESGSRRVSLQLGSGVLAFLVGSVLSNGIVTWLVEGTDGAPSGAAGFLLYWALGRLWLLLVLPAFGWMAGRFLGVRPFAYAAAAALSGEVLDTLVISATSGIELVFPSPADAVARVSTLLLGVALTGLLASQGAAAAARAQARAEAAAAEKAKEYQAFVARTKEHPGPSDK